MGDESLSRIGRDNDEEGESDPDGETEINEVIEDDGTQ